MTFSQLDSQAPPLPIAVIGAGPVGLVAAAHLVERGETPLILEAGDQVGAAVREWAHVRLFSPWKHLTDPVTHRMLEASGWSAPDGERLPTGGELVDRFLEPLAALPTIAPHLRLGRRVVAVTRKGMDKVKTAGRDNVPFELVVRTDDGATERHEARAVIDASGTYATPNPLGAGGVRAAGEAKLRGRIHYGIPDVFGRDQHLHAGHRTLVVGSGHSAFNTVLDLIRLAENAPDTEVLWAIRRKEPGLMFGGGEEDALPARASLGTRLKELVESGRVEFVTGFRIHRLEEGDDGVVVEGQDGRLLGPVDRVVATTGFRPDLELLRELRMDLDPWLEAPSRLAPLIDPNLHSCGTVSPHGYQELKHPESGVFVVGMKSYGRAPTFLLLTGYEQVRSVVCALTGDMEGASEVRLELPETGVCVTDQPDSACDEEAPGVDVAGEGCGAAVPGGSTASSKQTAVVGSREAYLNVRGVTSRSRGECCG